MTSARARRQPKGSALWFSQHRYPVQWKRKLNWKTVSAASVSCHYASLTWQLTESQRRRPARRADGSIWSTYTGITSRSMRLADRAVIFMPFLRRFSSSLSSSLCFSPRAFRFTLRWSRAFVHLALRIIEIDPRTIFFTLIFNDHGMYRSWYISSNLNYVKSPEMHKNSKIYAWK